MYYDFFRALAKRLGHMDLMEPMCKTDYLIADAAGVVLHRDRTLADGDACCMYVMRRKGSLIGMVIAIPAALIAGLVCII